LEEEICLEQIKTNQKIDHLEEKVEKLRTKVITIVDLNEVNKNTSDAIYQLERKISLEQIKTNKEVDQLEKKINLEQIKTNKKVDKLEEKIEKLRTKAITVEDLNEVNDNISDVIDPLDEKISLEHAVYHVKEVEEKAIIVVGGMGDTTKSVEAITTNGTPLCTLPDLPDNRNSNTMDNHILCGGTRRSTTTSCLRYGAGEWTKYRNDLKFERYHHVSWRRQDGTIMLIGGGGSKNTSEVVSSSGHQKGFNVQHEVFESCAIKLDDYLIITGGGYPTVATVSKYDKNGWIMDLPKLNTGRYLHACGHYYSETNELMYLVTGGVSLTSTEIMSSSGSSWSYVGNLPLATYGMGVISVNNQIFVIGGYRTGWWSLNSILKFNSVSNEWEKTGELSLTRYYHAATVLPMKDVKPYCL